MVQNYLGLDISSAIALICAYLSIKRLIAARIIEDAPMSKIRSAHQGYVELMGFTQLGTEEPLLSPLSQTPCLWYRYKIERYQSSGKNSQWRSIDRNNDGKIDLEECQLARSEARRKSERRYHKQPSLQTVHTINYSPSRHQPFIIATSESESLSRRFRWQALFLLSASICSGTVLIWLLNQP
ncbi:MAG: hypothetical protein ACI9BO_002053 [Zhongshania sp.]|jgi:hypothetical protein